MSQCAAKLVLLLAVAVAVAGAYSVCEQCMRKAIKKWKSDDTTAVNWCENAYVSVGWDMCMNSGVCGKGKDKGKLLYPLATKFCIPVHKSGKKTFTMAHYL